MHRLSARLRGVHRVGRVPLVALLAATLSAALLPGAPALAAPTMRPGRLVELRAGDGAARTLVQAAQAERGTARLQAATAAIQVTYTGFDSFPAAKAAFQSAVEEWQTRISSPVPIKVAASFTSLGAGVLGAAGPTYLIRDQPGLRRKTWYPAALGEARTGQNFNGTQPDIQADFNSAFSGWYFQLDGKPPAGKYDFKSVVLHELGHGLGFMGLGWVDSEGHGSVRIDLGSGAAPTQWDRLVTAGRIPVVNSRVYPEGSKKLGKALSTNSVRFEGARATRANGDVPVRLFAPAPFQVGSSYSHFDEATYPPGDPDSLMTPYLDSAEAIHTPGALALCLFADLGWTTSQSCPATPNGRLAAANASIREGNAKDKVVKLPITLSAPVRRNVSVTARTADVTARAGKDYRAVVKTVVFPPGVTTRALAVTVLGDRKREKTERFKVRLSGAFAAKVDDGVGVVRIRDND